MSSLAAVQADGFYHPPEYDGRKHGSVSKFHGSSGHNQWLKQGVVRLELPYKCWCLRETCNRVIAQGTRFNAKKRHVDDYFSTKIYDFIFQCPSCSQEMIMRTDPKNSDYQFISGIRKFDYTKSDDITETDHVVAFLDDETKEKLENDPLFALEYAENDKKRSQQRISHLLSIQEQNQRNFKDDFKSNRLLRKRSRAERKEKLLLVETAKRLNVGYELKSESTELAKEDTLKFNNERKIPKNNLKQRLPTLLLKEKAKKMSKKNQEDGDKVFVQKKKEKRRKKRKKKSCYTCRLYLI